jgi:hypothetical protein
MPHFGERRAYEPDSVDLVLAGRAFSARPVPAGAAAAPSAVVVNDADLVLAGQVFGRRSAAGAGSSSVGASLTVEEVDGSPTGTVTKIRFPNGSVGIVGSTATVTISGGSAFTYATTAPVGPALGDRWFDSTVGVGRLFTWCDDGASTQWVELGD